MKLWFYSSGDADDNAEMDEELVSELGVQPRLTFVPAHQCDAEEYYDEFINRFSQFGYFNFRLLDIEEPISRRMMRSILRSDMIYLSGGNTFHFLKYLDMLVLWMIYDTMRDPGGYLPDIVLVPF